MTISMERNRNSPISYTVVNRPATKGGVPNFKSVESQVRMKGNTVVKPVVYGNVAVPFTSQRTDDHTHQWDVYLKPYDNEDMSLYVKKVHFKLHDSYSIPIRVCDSPPYHVTETGWGEFEVVIKIFFHDHNERPVTIYHFLKLFDRDTNGLVKPSSSPVVSELYDELVFVDPTAKMFQLLTQPRAIPMGDLLHLVDFEEKKRTELGKILEAKSKVKLEISELRAKLAEAKSSIVQLKSQVASYQAS